jgi:tetratricopeptide (TPR) repeat protein
MSSRKGAWCVAACLVLAAGCVKKTVLPPPVPTSPAHAEFVYPAVPAALQGRPGASLVEIGWRYLQNDKTSDAERTFEVALKQNNTLYPARAGQGYVALAKRDYAKALTVFDGTLKAAPSYAPALVGRGQALIGLGREQDAVQPLEAALAIDPSLTDVRRRIDVLRFRGLQEVIEAAREAVRKGREPEARAAYARALAASPDSAFLYRELGMLDRKTGHPDQALDEFTRAATLEPSDAATFVQIGELLDEKSDFAGAEAAYRKAADIDPTPELSTRLATAAKKAREAKLPPEFRASLTSTQLTRGELAALIGVRFDDVIRDAPPRQVVITDTRGHWAAEWITPVARAGIMDPFANHTFQPRTRLRRGDLAMVVSRLLGLIAARDPDLRARLAQRPAIADMTPRHTQYAAAAAAVASGVMPLLAGDRFQVGQAVTGAEAVDALDRVRALAARTDQGAAF